MNEQEESFARNAFINSSSPNDFIGDLINPKYHWIPDTNIRE
jgi:hypothetical protein